MNNKYTGHPSQLFGVREVQINGGKADRMRMLEVRNGKGLEFDISLDRCADIPYLFYKGNSMAYIAPCGLVSPRYYDNKGAGFLKSFTAGFLTTCGLTAVGSPCADNGEELPLHGNISNVPAERFSYAIDDDFIKITAIIRDASLFGHKFLFEREYCCGIKDNTLSITDTITNIDCKETPYMVLYHCNFGYPLLHENAKLSIPSARVTPRDERAAEDLDTHNVLIKPSSDFVEQCYYHEFKDAPVVSIENPDIMTKMEMTFSSDTLDCFTQWKMMGEGEYVMGLEPGNCYPDGRDVMREKGILKFLKPGERTVNKIVFKFLDI